MELENKVEDWKSTDWNSPWPMKKRMNDHKMKNVHNYTYFTAVLPRKTLSDVLHLDPTGASVSKPLARAPPLHLAEDSVTRHWPCWLRFHAVSQSFCQRKWVSISLFICGYCSLFLHSTISLSSCSVDDIQSLSINWVLFSAHYFIYNSFDLHLLFKDFIIIHAKIVLLHISHFPFSLVWTISSHRS